METQTPQTHTDADILKRLKSRNKSVRQTAERELGQLPPERLFALLEMEAQNQQRRYRWVRIADRWNWLTIMLPVIIGTLTQPVWGIRDMLYMAIVMVFFMFLPGNLMLLLHPSNCLYALFRATQKQDSMAMIRCCLRLYQSGMTASVEEYLIKHLPQIRASDRTLWTHEDQSALIFLLSDCCYSRPQLACAALKALEQVGVKKALPIVKELASGRKHFGPLWLSLKPEVKQAAIDCLPYLEQNAIAHTEEQTLLRISSAPSDNTPETLLRPATSNPEETPHEQLLRSASDTS